MKLKDMFIDDEEKIKDLLYLSKEEFLKEYSYITEAEYENTINQILLYVNAKLTINKKTREKRNQDLDKSRKITLDYYYANRDKINARRKELRDMRKQQK